MGAACIRHSLRPLLFRGRNSDKPRALTRCGKVESRLLLAIRQLNPQDAESSPDLVGRSSISEAAVRKSRQLWNTGCPGHAGA